MTDELKELRYRKEELIEAMGTKEDYSLETFMYEIAKVNFLLS